MKRAIMVALLTITLLLAGCTMPSVILPPVGVDLTKLETDIARSGQGDAPEEAKPPGSSIMPTLATSTVTAGLIVLAIPLWILYGYAKEHSMPLQPF